MNFSEAIIHLKQGYPIQNTEWDDRSFIILKTFSDGMPIIYRFSKSKTGTKQVDEWTIRYDDILVGDWRVVAIGLDGLAHQKEKQ